MKTISKIIQLSKKTPTKRNKQTLVVIPKIYKPKPQRIHKEVQTNEFNKSINNTLTMKNKKKLSRARANKGEKVFQMKGTFQEVWKEYMKLNEQLKNN